MQDRRGSYLEAARTQVGSPGRDLERVHQRFATGYATGCLAIRYEVFPYDRKELGRALLACERAHVDHVAQFVRAPSRARRPAPAVVDPLERLRRYVRQNQSKFVDLRDGLLDRRSGHDHDSCPGYVNRGSDGSVEMLFSNSLLLRLCGGHIELRRLKEELEESGRLIRDSHRRVARRSIWKGPNGRVHVTAVRTAMFEDE